MKKGLKVFLFVSVLVGFHSLAGFCWPVPDTGQTKCYDEAGAEIACPPPGDPLAQDGTYIHQMSYTKLGYGGTELYDSAAEWLMVMDNVTGLIWEVKQNKNEIADYANPNDADNRYTWYDSNPDTNEGYPGTAGEGIVSFDTEQFIQTLNNRNLGGFSDWRLPTAKELDSLVNLGRNFPAINTDFFPYAEQEFHWSSDHTSDGAWGMAFRHGVGNFDAKSNANAVRAVRAGKIPGNSTVSTFVDNGDGTVTDINTGLMWRKATLSGAVNWSQALSACEDLNDSGYVDWRLPDRKELKSLVDFNRSNPAVDPNFFPETLSEYYWTSTTSTYDPANAWHVNFYYGGFDGSSSKSKNYHVRPVRGGQQQIPETLIILSPEQASGWSIGSRMPIIWDTQNISGNVKISISRAGGRADSFEVITASTPNDGQFDWTVTGPTSVNCALKIEPISDSSKGNIQSLFRIGDILVDPAGLTVTEPDGSATFKIRFGKEPTADVVIDLFSTNPGECRVSPGTIILNSTNWSTGVEVTVTAEPDGIIDGDQISSILTGLSSSADPFYDGLNIANVIITVEDADTGLAIDSVYPTYGQVGTNLDVKITGVNFDSNTQLYIYPDGGTPSAATPVTLESPSLLSATLTDPGTAGNYTLEVSDGTYSATMPWAITFADAAAIQAQNRKKAIIVAGSGPFPDNDMWLATESLTKLAYIGLITQGYSEETIRYLTFSNASDISGNGQSDVDGLATIAELETAIKNWAASGTDELILYMVGPGRSSGFQFGSNNDPTFLSPATLDTWIDDLQTVMTGPVIIVYDACRSGSFIAPLAGTNRTLITGTSSDERAWFLFDGEISFSGIFWSKIFSLGELYDAFRDAETMMLPLQTPLIETDGDGTADSLPPKLSGVREIPDKYLVGRGRFHRDAPLVIDSVAAEPELLKDGDKTATMSAGPITDTNGSGISNVWALIISPLEEYASTDESVLVVPDQKLQDREGNGIYMNSYDEFRFSGSYPIYIYAVDRSDNPSWPKAAEVIQTDGLVLEKGDLDIDGDIDLADVLIALKVAAGLKPPRAYTAFEVNGDGKVGLVEAIYDLMKVAELR